MFASFGQGHFDIPSIGTSAVRPCDFHHRIGDVLHLFGARESSGMARAGAPRTAHG